MSLLQNLTNKGYLILFLNSLLYFLIFFIRHKSGGPYGTIEYQISNSFLWALVFSALLLLYFLAYKVLKNLSFKLILIGYLIFSAFLMLTPVLSSFDIYMYAMRGRIVSNYQENPYLKSAADFPNDSFLRFTSPAWRPLKQNYGPLWTVFSSCISRIGQNKTNWTFLLYKLWGFLGNSLALFFLYKISKIYNPQKLKRVLFLYAWNPLVLVEFINNAHNDIWMVLFGLLALYFYYTKKDSFIIPALTLAGLVKYVYWILIPIFFVFLLRQRRITLKRLVVSSVFSILFLVSVYFPFWNGVKIFNGLIEQGSFWGRIPTQYSLPLFLGTLLLGSTIRQLPTFSFVFLSIILWCGRMAFLIFYVRQFFSKKLIKTISVVIGSIVFLFVATAYPWYIIWWLPLLMLQNNIKAVFFWSMVGLFAYIFMYSVSLSLIIIGGIYLLTFNVLKVKNRALMVG